MNLHDQGFRELGRISGGTGKEIAGRLERLSSTMRDLLVSQGYGTVFAGPELSRQFREVATVAILAAGGYQSELRIHLKGALRVGVDPAELVALAEHLSLYAGLPRMIEMADLLSDIVGDAPSPLLGRPLSLEDHETRLIDRGGTGPPLVLIHSIGTSRWSFRPLLDRLGDQFRGISYDLRGHGSAHADASTVSIEAWVNDLALLIDRLGLERIHLAGLSLGGSVALAFADRYPDRLLSLHLLAPPSPDPGKYAGRARSIREDGSENQIGPTLGRWFTPAFLGADPWEVRITRESLRVMDPDSWAASFEALATIPSPLAVRKYPFPTIFLGGEKDQSVPPEDVRRLAALCEGAVFRLVPGAPHQMALETPEALLTLLLETKRV